MKLFDLMHLLESFSDFGTINIQPKDDSGKEIYVRFGIYEDGDVDFIVDDGGKSTKSGSLFHEKTQPGQYDGIRDMEINLNSIEFIEKRTLIRMVMFK